MKLQYRARCCHSSVGSFVYAEPSWLLRPEDSSDDDHTHVQSCFYMSSDQARQLARDLIRAAVDAEGQVKREPQQTEAATP